ncbi:MAG: benzoate-CoA ligase family protein [Solirubrobacterales bacterium]|nr:benzoate-CoA ligase family protein [Solirubrobacterales bacterium]MBV9717380.1 benzoate-CoA ligase family protein [Solirubrobacterales bacterium]
MERARVNGVELEYELKGSGEPVLLIHGSHIAGSFIPLLAQPSLSDGYMLVRYHRRGFCDSAPARGAFSISDQAADARALLEHLGVQAAHVVGHSYGGAIALQLAVDAPQRVHSLALLEPAVLSVPRGKVVFELIAVAKRLYDQGHWEAAEDFFLGTPRERADIARCVPGGLEQALRDMDTYFAVEAPAHEEWRFGAAEGGQIKCPALYVLGGESSRVYVEVHDHIKEWMPQTETVVLEGASHLLHIQEPAGAAVLLRNFFARHPMTLGARQGQAARGVAGRRGRYNAAVDLLDGNLERGLSEKEAIRTYARSHTYGELARGANRIGNALRGLGVEMENRVLLALPDAPEFAVAFFGAIKIGAIPVPVNTNLRPLEYAELLEDTRAKAAVVHTSLAPAFRRARRGTTHLRHLVVTGEAERDELSLGDLTGAAEDDLSPAHTMSDDQCFWLYTSGTSGRPKGVTHVQHDMRFCADTYARHVLHIEESDVTFSVSKLYWAYGLGNSLYFPFSVGGTAVLLAEPPQPRAVLEVVKELRPTIFFAVPTSYSSLLAARWKEDYFNSVRVCVSAGEALSGSLLERWQEKTGLPLLDGIGSTETCHIFISNRLDDVRPDCTGTVVDGFEAKVVDDEGRVVPDGRGGILMVKGESTSPFYWHDELLTRESMHGAWLRTGDTFIKDESEHFYFHGRSDEMLKVGGMWVSPLEVEAVLNEHDAVAECAVMGVEDEDGLTRPEAWVVLKENGGEQQLEPVLRQHMRQRVGGNKTPRAFHFVSALPERRSVNGEDGKATNPRFDDADASVERASSAPVSAG